MDTDETMNYTNSLNTGRVTVTGMPLYLQEVILTPTNIEPGPDCLPLSRNQSHR